MTAESEVALLHTKRKKGQLEVRRNMFYWRGKWFSGLVDPDTNALYDNPDDSFLEYVRSTANPNQDQKS